MRRWTLDSLVDFVRGVATPEERAAIEADLAAIAAGRQPGDAATMVVSGRLR